MFHSVWKLSGWLRRVVFTSVPELITAIDEYIAHHNNPPRAIHLDRSRHLAESYSRQYVTHDHTRNGTTTLFAALNVLDGHIIAQCQQRHHHTEWLKFFRKIDRETTKKDKAAHPASIDTQPVAA